MVRKQQAAGRVGPHVLQTLKDRLALCMHGTVHSLQQQARGLPTLQAVAPRVLLYWPGPQKSHSSEPSLLLKVPKGLRQRGSARRRQG